MEGIKLFFCEETIQACFQFVSELQRRVNVYLKVIESLFIVFSTTNAPDEFLGII